MTLGIVGLECLHKWDAASCDTGKYAGLSPPTKDTIRDAIEKVGKTVSGSGGAQQALFKVRLIARLNKLHRGGNPQEPDHNAAQRPGLGGGGSRPRLLDDEAYRIALEVCGLIPVSAAAAPGGGPAAPGDLLSDHLMAPIARAAAAPAAAAPGLAAPEESTPLNAEEVAELEELLQKTIPGWDGYAKNEPRRALDLLRKFLNPFAIDQRKVYVSTEVKDLDDPQ